jgi:hypothetical protein
MPLTKSEAMYFALGVAVGGAVGANWSKIKPIVEQFFGGAAEGAGDAYSDLSQMFGERFEAFQDHAAERRHRARATRNGKPSKRRRRATKQAKNGAPILS